MRLSAPWIVTLAVLPLAAWLRFVDLGRATVRADEINFLQQVIRGQSVSDLWQNPPWLNQIPFADIFTMLWNGIRPGPPDEQTLREPYALIGTLTVVGVTWWLTRRRGIAAGVLVGIWISLLPYHVYQSREAYYYVVAMAFAAGMTLQTVDMLARCRQGESLSWRTYAGWTAWAFPTCLTHMSTWVVVLACWALLVAAGVRYGPEARRRQHVMLMIAAAAVLGLLMERWVFRAIEEVKNPMQGLGHIGEPFGWIASRVILYFTVGANLYGIAAVVALVAAGWYALTAEMRRPQSRRDPWYDALTLVTFVGLAAEFAFVGAVGGGKGKVTYFSAVLPAFLAWAAYTLDIVAASLPDRWPKIARAGLPCLAFSVLAMPAWMTMRLDGKPSPYKLIRDWLDTNLDPGSVVLGDRWFEPWNEMAQYAPAKVFVTFTVPDDPYDNYVQFRWRDVTEQFIENGGAQAFIRLTRNHEQRAGLWTWPEKHFARHAVVVNDAAVWLRRNGYDVLQPFSTSSSAHQLTTEIFYDLQSDVVARKRATGERFVVFYDDTLRYEKSGPMGIFRVQTQQFMDWRVLAEAGTFDVFNLTDKEQRAFVKLRGVAPGGTKLVIGPGEEQKEFSGGQLQDWFIGPVVLQPGSNTLSLKDPRWAESQNPLFIAGIEIETVPDPSP
jgi:hypothetical protein